MERYFVGKDGEKIPSVIGIDKKWCIAGHFNNITALKLKMETLSSLSSF